MKFLLTALLAVSFSVQAQDFKIISYGPKSGPTTNLGMLISNNLDNKPEVVATGDCQEATRQFNNEKSAIAVVGHASMVKGQVAGKNCEIPFKHTTVFMVRGYYDVCHRVDHKGSLNDSNVRLSVPAVFPVKQFITDFNQLNGTKIKTIGVAGGGEAMASLLSGDVEYTILPRFNSVKAEQEGKVACVSLRPGDLKYLGLTHKIKSEPFYFMVFVMHKGLEAEHQKQLLDSFNKPDVRKWLDALAWKQPMVLPTSRDVREARAKIEEHRKLYQK